jgi:hypothetical protein
MEVLSMIQNVKDNSPLTTFAKDGHFKLLAVIDITCQMDAF